MIHNFVIPSLIRIFDVPSKVLSLGKLQIYLRFRLLIRTFVPVDCYCKGKKDKEYDKVGNIRNGWRH